MSDKLIINSVIGLSKVPEVALSTPKTLAADFLGAETSALNVVIPGVEKILNAGLIGRGDEWATRSDPDYMRHTGMTFSDRLNTGHMALHAARALSGDITSTEVVASSGVYDHVIEMKASSLDPQLQSSSIAFSLGGFDFLLAGMCVNNFGINIQGAQAPTFQCEYVGTGYYEYMADQSPALVIPAAVDQDYVGQRSQTSMQFNDGTVFDVSGLGRADSFSLQYSNNLITNERRIGDALADPTDDNSGAFVRQLTRDNRSAQLSMGVYVSTDKRGYLAHLSNTDITALKVKSVGNREIGTTNMYHEVEVIATKLTILPVDLGGDRKGIYTLNFAPLKDAAEDGIIKIRIRNASPTLNA
jgi:hypothetical protein